MDGFIAGVGGCIVFFIVGSVLVWLILEIGIWETLAIVVVIGIIYVVIILKKPTSGHNYSYDLRRAAEEGHAASQYLMGNAYMDAYRSGVENRDEALKKAIYWYR